MTTTVTGAKRLVSLSDVFSMCEQSSCDQILRAIVASLRSFAQLRAENPDSKLHILEAEWAASGEHVDWPVYQDREDDDNFAFGTAPLEEVFRKPVLLMRVRIKPPYKVEFTPVK